VGYERDLDGVTSRSPTSIGRRLPRASNDSHVAPRDWPARPCRRCASGSRTGRSRAQSATSTRQDDPACPLRPRRPPARRPAPPACSPLRLRAVEAGIGVDLIVTDDTAGRAAGRCRVQSQGRRSPGNASHYYSFTRLATHGTITIAGTQYAVEGLSWLDREWSTSALDEGQVGWDWFALQLDDGTDVMLYQLRRDDGSADRYSRGTIVDPDGSARGFGFEGLVLDTLAGWSSPRGGRYPARWRLRVPAESLDIEISPVLPDQEHDAYVRYWEGAVDVRGRRGGAPIAGHGYVELTGYADVALRR
jgi:hypothetical protein